MVDKQTGKTVEVPPNPQAAVIARLATMAAAIPDGGQETGLAGLIESIMAAATAEELSAPWDGAGGEALIGKRLVIHTLKRRPSTMDSPVGFFLVVDYADAGSGDRGTFTTGSASIVVQLTTAHHYGWLPIEAEIVKAERPTPDGFYPQHLKVHGRYGEGF